MVGKEEIKNLNRNFNYDAKERISIFLGAYGSGKSEVAVNFALMLANREKNKACREITLADLDIINPYYRSLDAKKVLNDNGVSVISPLFANTNAEAPVIPGEVYSVFDQESTRAVLDIGGEDMGARIVSNLKNKILHSDFAVYMVVNMKRPFTDTKEKVIRMMQELEDAAGLKITGLVNNTNLLEDSTLAELTEANQILAGIYDETGVPLCFAAGMHAQYPEVKGNILPDQTPYLSLARTILYDEPANL